MLMPWRIKRICLSYLYGYNLHKNAHIGLAYVFPRYLEMHKGATIDHFTVAIHLDKIIVGENSSIGRSNWITGFPMFSDAKHFSHQSDRKSELIIASESAITKHHHIDCTNYIHIGHHTTIAGYYSQFLTHSINVYDGRQDSHPIVIGDYTFVSTSVKILGGSKLPSYSVLAAGAVLGKQYDEEWCVYGGVPAKNIKKIPRDAKYFLRTKGFVI